MSQPAGRLRRTLAATVTAALVALVGVEALPSPTAQAAGVAVDRQAYAAEHAALERQRLRQQSRTS